MQACIPIVTFCKKDTFLQSLCMAIVKANLLQDTRLLQPAIFTCISQTASLKLIIVANSLSESLQSKLAVQALH